MAALTLPTAGDVRVIGWSRLPDETGGAPRRTIGGQLRGDPLWTARAWEASILCATDAEAALVYADAAGDAAITGDLAGAVTVRMEVTGDEYTPHGTTWERVLSVRIREQL